VRIVLMKDFDEQGFVFYTNHASRKGREALETKVAALNFHWPAMDMQVRIEGGLSVVSNAEADTYFASRPRESQLGAWASLQSQVLPIAERARAAPRRPHEAVRRPGRPPPAALERLSARAPTASSSGRRTRFGCTGVRSMSAAETAGTKSELFP
jgi:pyridoxamine 5'-phosphate oxidase